MPVSRKISLVIPELDLSDEYRKRFDYKEMINHRIKLLNNYYDLSYSKENRAQMSPLCWYNFQYFEYAVALGAEYKDSHNEEYYRIFRYCFFDYVKQDINLEPYVVSLQIPNLLIAIELFENAIDIKFFEALQFVLYKDYLFLQSNLETHILGNHYLENLKALIIASYYFREDKKCKKYLKMFKSELKEEILSDGMHFELSPMYHKIILEDLLRILCLVKYDSFPKCDWIIDKIQMMINAMYFLENKFNSTPLFNDSGDNIAKSSTQYIMAVNRALGIKPQPCVSLPEAGYYRLDNDAINILIDSGPIGPKYIPGHGHCDCLSFELAINGEKVFVNSGTLLYQGELRAYFRSTKAHNTITMDGNEQSECWGEHRVARRISSIKTEIEPGIVKGEYKNYLGQIHKRTFELKDNEVIVVDEMIGVKSAKSYLHVSDKYFIRNDFVVVSKRGEEVCKIEALNCSTMVFDDGKYAPEFGKQLNSYYVVFSYDGANKKQGYRIKLLRRKEK